MKGTKEQKKKKDIVHGNVLCVRIKPFTMTIKHIQKKVFLRAKISITLRNDWIKCKQVNFKLFLVLTFKQTYTFTLKI